ncbi:hypothetical protein [Streptomyces sp. SID8352]|uniref:hypothetical protein n=1 Tax=Streptomyces sp. SID8352 TaxID=2690338 RepID=UPI001369E4EE|nr:hypothetical protein [Streptomyces sp. SID8352]MYU25442.1 hypothetical protein [Streptomyces sp. SID8352]
MQMNSVPQHLSREDRQEYERVLDEALRSAPHRPELSGIGQRYTSQQLRTLALAATVAITEAAAAEYQHYVKVREALRHPAPQGLAPSGPTASGPEGRGADAAGLAASVGEAAGAGAVAVIAVLTPVLAGTAATIFLIVGFLLKAFAPERAFARTMLTMGWFFGAVTVVAILVAAAGLLITALRNRPSAESGRGGPDEEVALARDAWHDALLHRGILPFLRDRLAGAGAPAVPRTGPAAPAGRMPHLGYGRPGFSSPGDGPAAGSRPSYSSPDYSSPDFGGPDHQPE